MSYEDTQKTGGWIFVIDTDEYAGNFERELTAYLTGQVGECGVGDHMAEAYVKETGDKDKEKFGDLLEHRADDRGCHRPCSIYPTKGWFNHGHGGHFRDGEDEKALKDYIKQCRQTYGKEYMANPLRAKEALEKGEKYSNWTMPDVEREIKRLNKEVEKAEATKKVRHYPAYMSVAVFFFEKPSTEIIQFMKERAKTFVAAKRRMAEEKEHSWEKNFKLNIEGFRLVKETLSSDEEKV